jgi:uncharacterized protein YhfF
MRARLNELVLTGQKRATAGTTEEYDDNEYEHVGERLALVDDDLHKVGVVEVTGTALTTFGAVPWSFAQAEAEGDESLDQWREGHRRFWTGEGVVVTDDMPVFLVYFTLVAGPMRHGEQRARRRFRR